MNLAGIPVNTSKWSFIRETFFYESIAAFVTFCMTIYKLRSDQNSDWPLFALAFALFLLVAIKSYNQWDKQKGEQQLHELSGCLFTLHGLLTAALPRDVCDPKLRITLHVPIEDGQKLQQVLDYVGNDRSKNTAGRKFLANCGAVGEALRLKQPVSGKRANDNYEEYVKELIQDHHFTEKDARKMDRDTMCWMANPFFVEGNDDKVEAVLYLDSVDREFFTDEREQLIICACSGIARFVKRRYY